MLGAPLASDILEDQGRNIEKSSLFTPIRKTGVCAVFGVLIFTSLAAFFCTALEYTHPPEAGRSNKYKRPYQDSQSRQLYGKEHQLEK